MKKIVVLVILFLVIPGIIIITQKSKYNKIKQQTRLEITKIEGTADRVLSSNYGFYRKMSPMVDYLKALVKKMETRAVLGIYVFDREEREQLYRRFFDKLMDFRRQMVELEGDVFSIESKIKYMRGLMMACNVLIHQSPATNDKEDDKNDIFAMWCRDMSKLVLSEDDFPKEEKRKRPAPEQAPEWAGLDFVDGKPVSPRVTERKYLAQETRTPVSLDQLKNYIGKEFEIQLKSGDVEEGTLLAVDARSIKLNVFLGGGRVSMLIPIDGIKKVEMKTVEKEIIVKQTKIIEKPKTNPWDEYKEMTVKGLHPVSDLMKRYRQGSRFNEGYVLITKDNKMYWISDDTGRLVAHSHVTRENFKVLATGVKPRIIWCIGLANHPGMIVANYDWVSVPPKNVPKRIDPNKLILNYKPVPYHTQSSEFELFELRFKIRLVKEIPGIKKKVEIEEKDLVLNDENIRTIVKADYVSQLVEMMEDARYGEGDKPWEYNIVRGMPR